VFHDGGGMGKGGAITLSANGSKVAEGRLDRTVPQKFPICEGLDVGMDVGSPVDFTYTPPFKFTGKIEKVTIKLRPGGGEDTSSEETDKARTAGQKQKP
jgi:arylsulfatase